MRWRYHRKPSFGAALDASGDVEAFAIDRNGNDLASTGSEDGARKAISWFFHPNLAASVEQEEGRDLKRLLRAADDHDLIGFAAHSARRSQVAGNLFAQVFRSQRMAIIKRLRLRVAAVTRHQTVPDRKRKMIKRYLAHPERSPTAVPGPGLN